ncbi:hypothetical protein [Ornithinibacillus californiensis]|uniref:hypothetical protein n=1 Tax=Ornithinibacillus californiensis TaxID=161536 RepID=UPI00064E06DA|nr:hypothetical protein [Ornithinibacillus californiensis]
MQVKWTKQALEGFNNIRSKHFTLEETIQYKKVLASRIHEKISILGTSMKVEKSEWEGSYKVLVDKYIVYYSFSEDRSTCYIEYFKHFRQNR